MKHNIFALTVFASVQLTISSVNIFSLFSFLHQVADGVNCLTVGSMNDLSGRLVFAGGNCSVQGFDFDGEDVYWTVRWY